MKSWWTFFGVGGWLSLAMLVGCGAQNLVLRSQARDQMRLHEYDQAQATLRQALDNDPADWQALELQAQLCMTQEKFLEAQLLLEKALAIHPDGTYTSQLLDELSQAMYRQREQSDRLTTFLHQTALERKTSDDYLRLAKYEGLLGNSEGATTAFLKAAKMAPPTDPTPYLKAADYYQAIGARERMVTMLRHAYTIDPFDARTNQRLRDAGLVPGPTIQLAPLSEAYFPPVK